MGETGFNRWANLALAESFGGVEAGGAIESRGVTWPVVSELVARDVVDLVAGLRSATILSVLLIANSRLAANARIASFL